MWVRPDPWSCSYLLGMYLGDGCLWVRPGGGAQLQLACDAAYPQLIEDCRASIVLTTIGAHVFSYRVPG